MTSKAGERWHGVDTTRSLPIKSSKADWVKFTTVNPAVRLPADASVMIGADFDIGVNAVLGDAE